ncbi:MAG: energy transducer TonB [bacterium]
MICLQGLKKVFIIIKVKSKKILYLALLLSVVLHIVFGITVESYLRFLLKKAPLTDGKEQYFEILPYAPKDSGVIEKAPKNARFYGPKNLSPSVETAPKAERFSTPRVIEQLLSPSKDITENRPITQPPSPPVLKPEAKKDAPTNEQAVITQKLQSEKRLPSLEKLIPKTPELIAKMPKEESINLNRGTVKDGKELVIATKEYKYWSYLDKMKRKIELLWQYPEEARINGISGSLKINFAVDKSGKLKDVVLVESSGYKFFDNAAMKALRDASPFAPFPDTWDIERLNIEGTFIYEIKVIR